jgi:hypothetical protein
MINAISLQLYFILQENHEGMETDWTISASTLSDNVNFLKRNKVTHQCLEYLKALDRWTRYEWAISASTGSDNVSLLNRNNGTHQFLEYLMALDRWSGNEYQLLEYLISDCWSGTVWNTAASTGSDVNFFNRNKVTHQFLEYLKALDRWTRNEWIYQLLECLIILDCWTGSEWDISAYRVHDDVIFFNAGMSVTEENMHSTKWWNSRLVHKSTHENLCMSPGRTPKPQYTAS